MGRPWEAAGFGKLLIADIASGNKEVTNATVTNDVIVGDPVMLSLHFVLDEDIPAATPTLDTLSDLDMSDSLAMPLDVEILQLLMRTQSTIP